MRRVKERDALALQCKRHLELLGYGVVARQLDDRPEVLSESLNGCAVFGAAQQDELGGVVETRQFAQ